VALEQLRFEAADEEVPKSDQKRNMSEPTASWFRFPISVPLQREPRRGSITRSPFFASFLAAGEARSKKSE